MYMLNPVALPVNSSPGWVFPKVAFETPDEQIVFLARFAHGILSYKQKIERFVGRGGGSDVVLSGVVFAARR
jgi:hypothetical protein